MNNRIFIVDRLDQVKWYVDPESVAFCLQLKDNHRELRKWLEDMTHDTVVISGQGVMPRPGGIEHPNKVYDHMNRDQYKLYFASEDDAVLFKLTWGGE